MLGMFLVCSMIFEVNILPLSYWNEQCIDRTTTALRSALLNLIALLLEILLAITWRRWRPGSSLWHIPRIRGVTGVRPRLGLDVLEDPGVRVDEEELPDEGTVSALLLVEAVQADPSSGVTHHQPQRLPNTAEIKTCQFLREKTLSRILTQRGSRWSWPRPWSGAPWRRLSPGWMCPWPEREWQMFG